MGYAKLEHHEDLDAAEAMIRKALDASPDNPAFLDSLGWVRYRRGDIPGALPNLERAYRIFPDPEIASHWGELLWLSGKQAEARALWARSLARAPDSKPLRATIERLTGTKMDPPKPAQDPDTKPQDKLPPSDSPAPATTGS
jgi:tetratricopeptide (TPR) repeat protein